MKTNIARTERILRQKVEQFLENSGATLNGGSRLNINTDGELTDPTYGDGPVSCCLLGAVLWKTGHDIWFHSRAALVLSCTEAEAMAIERGYWHTGFAESSDDPSFVALGARMRADYYQAA